VIVVSDTSPLNYLILVGQVDVLRILYGTVCLPEAVERELKAPETPPSVRDWIMAPPPWLEIRKITTTLESSLELHAGERQAIALAKELGVLLLMDDFDGRSEARRLGLDVVGTLGVLDDAAERGLLDFTAALGQLLRTSFRVAPDLLEQLRQRESLRRQRDADKEKPSEPA
jgi:predicted nucleic acid-binding protein